LQQEAAVIASAKWLRRERNGFVLEAQLLLRVDTRKTADYGTCGNRFAFCSVGHSEKSSEIITPIEKTSSPEFGQAAPCSTEKCDQESAISGGISGPRLSEGYGKANEDHD
jgi:hypothetical protein